MKATGIVRRIDDLGRVVIPKEIRRTMRIREGDPAAAAALAHVLKGSARGVGAWQVANAAEEVEAACAGKADLPAAVETLTAAIVRSRAVIADHL